MSTGMKCANCGKGVMYGHNMSHAKNRTNRIFAPNLHPARVLIDGAMKRVKLCVKCLRKLKKETIKKSSPIIASPVVATA
ncbi:MAG: rpmB [Candidatus Levybacteria bacterium]|nr:rpmB [Candidatus Levybacteria bacterium]